LTVTQYLDESSHAMLRLLPQIIKSKHKDIAGPCLSIMATQAASRALIPEMNA
jgi:hypothetical protein